MTLRYFVSIIFFVLYISSATVQCASNLPKHNRFIDKALAYWAQSRFMERYSDRLAKKYEPYSEQSYPADDIQRIGLKAQEHVGIKKERQILMREDSDPASDKYVYTTFGNIYLNKARLKSVSYGTANSILHHEAAHRYFNDPACARFVRNITFVGLALVVVHPFFSMKKSISLSNIFLRTVMGPPAVYLISHVSGERYTTYVERRADIVGYNATQCHACVSEVACTRRLGAYDPNYLSAEEIDLIAAQLKQKEKVCDFHQASCAYPADDFSRRL